MERVSVVVCTEGDARALAAVSLPNINFLVQVPKEDTMNTFTEIYPYLAVLLLFALPSLVAVVAFRAVRDHALTSVKVYKWTGRYISDSRWVYQRMARSMYGLKFEWPFMTLTPRWFQPEESRSRSLSVVPWKQFRDTDEYYVRRFHKDGEYYLLVQRPDRTVFNWLAAIDLFVVGLIAATLFWFSGRSSATPEPIATQVAVEPTSTPRPTATPEPEVEVVDGGDSIVIDLDQQAVGDALLEWLNEHAKGTSIPTLSGPLVDWINSLPWPEVAAFEMPEGMDGFVVVARKSDGFELLRLDDKGNFVGGPIALKNTKEFTLHARELKWGVRYTDKFRVTNESQGHIDVYVAESGEPTMATGYHLFNFRWWHIAVLIIVIIIGGVVYRRLTY